MLRLHYCLDPNDSGFNSTADIDITEASSLITSTPKHVRPTVGMKRPRANLITTANKCPRRQGGPECSQCLHLLAENKELRDANALLTEQLAQSREAAADLQLSEAPRPGKVPRAIAEHNKVRFVLDYIRQTIIMKGCLEKTFSDV